MPLANQTPRYERKREDILEAAARLFNTRGLNGVTIADVAQAVGLTTTSITYYYRKKEDLAAACLMRALGALEALVEAAEAAPTAPERLILFVELYFALLAEMARGRAPWMINFWDLRSLTGDSAETTLQAFVALYRRVRAIFQAPEGPDLSRSEQNARAHLVLSALIRAKEWVTRYEADDYPRAAARFGDIMLNGLAPAGAGWTPPPGVSLKPAICDAEAVSRETFLRAATELVNEHGYRGASVDRISAKLKVTKGSFYHHNETKDDLIAACFARTFDVLRDAHRAVFAREADGWTRLCALADGLVSHQLSPQGPLLRYSALSATVEAMRPGLLATFGRLSEKTAGLIADGVADGSVRPVDPAVAAQMVMGMINAAGELTKWSPAATESNAGNLFAKPLFFGVFSPGIRG